MGRSNFGSILSRAYCYFPIPCVGADVTGTTDWNNSINYAAPVASRPAGEVFTSGLPTAIGSFNNSASDLRSNALFSGLADKQAIMWSAAAIAGSAGTVNLDFRTSSGSGPTLTTPLALTPPLTHPSGVVEGSWRATSNGAPSLLGANNRSATATGGRTSVVFFDASDASHGVTRPGACVIYTPFMLADSAAPTTPIILDRPYTFYPGAVKGAYVLVPMEGNDLASGQTAATVRRITAPQALRLHVVCFQSSVSGASNTCKLRNVTQNVDITGDIALTGAAGSAVEVPATSLSNRNIAKGDVLEIIATTAGTGFTGLGAMLTAHTTGHIHTDSPMKDTIVHPTATTTIEPEAIYRHSCNSLAHRTNFSGPARGSIAFLPFAVRFTVASGQTDLAVARVIAPFDCYAWQTAVFYRASAASNTYTIRNITKSLDLIAAQSITSAGSASDAGLIAELANNSISRGDVLELRVTTAGTGITAIGGMIGIHVRGHANASAASD